MSKWWNSDMVVSLVGLSVAFRFSKTNKSGKSSFENLYDVVEDFGDFYCDLMDTEGYMIDLSYLDWRKPTMWKGDY